MKIIKRSGSEVLFDREKIVLAIKKANNRKDVNEKERLSPYSSKDKWEYVSYETAAASGTRRMRCAIRSASCLRASSR